MGKIFINSEIIIAIILIVCVLLQHQGAGLGGAFGGEGNSYRSRRGMEKGLYMFTIILACLFAIIALLAVLIK